MKQNGFLFVLIGVLVTNSALADTSTTSQKYVDDALAQKENIFTAKSTDTLVTYPKTGGNAVERQIKSTLDNSTTDTSVVTAGAANAKIETRQNKLAGYTGAVVNLNTNGFALSYGNEPGEIVPRVIAHLSGQQAPTNNALVPVDALEEAVYNATNGLLSRVDENGNADANGTLWQLNSIPPLITVNGVFTSIAGLAVRLGKNEVFTLNFDNVPGWPISAASYAVNNKAKINISASKNRNLGCSTRVLSNVQKGTVVDFSQITSDIFGTNCYCPKFATQQTNGYVPKWVYLGIVDLLDGKCNCPVACANEIKTNVAFRQIVLAGTGLDALAVSF